ncbi:phosphotriesterase family protein [Leucobacter tenebrionis]|uniref:phosphotriesterase family protein n=1 Tax=Leucobacter tenebrionis TaxID=2873270 RepID=UPI001CA67B6F|nr:hypothetical protein [Leucobacter tenebrionis]QZY51663.1 hypothetical protein KVY00_14055 [Leucobacter tenebrionis]
MPVIETVLGAVDAAPLRTVLAAETLLCAPPQQRGNAGLPATDAEFARAAVSMPMLGRLMLGAPNIDDRTLVAADAEGALDTLAAATGGQNGDEGGDAAATAVIALAGFGSTADRASLACLSRASGIAIVRGVDGRAAGADGRPARDDETAPHGGLAPRDDPEAAGERIAVELEEFNAGVVGAIPLPGAAQGGDSGSGASSAAPDADRALLAAAAAAAHRAGAALVLAPRTDPWAVSQGLAGGVGDTEERAARDTVALFEEALEVAESAGLDRSRVILTGAAGLVCDASGAGADHGRLDALLDLGAAICFDQLGRIPNVRTIVSDHDIAVAILRAAERGAASRILLSCGIRNKHRLASYGGNGLEFVPQQFLPYLRMLGADDALVRAVGGGNALRLLAREPARAGEHDDETTRGANA